MAAVSIQPSPQPPHRMTTGRRPLATLPNAANSPFRGTTATTKRARSHASEQRDLAYGQPPPAKKQIIEVDDAEARRNSLLRRAGYNQPTTLLRKLEASREAKPAQRATERLQKQEANPQNLDSIRQWRKHYQKAFPHFVFYFESIPDDTRAKISKQVQSLGARVDTFFSNEVTHVVTTRPIPPETNRTSSGHGHTSSQAPSTSQVRTINPSLLERTAESGKGKFTFEAAHQKKPNGAQILAEVEPRRQQTNSILHKAREMNMKIWALEKIQRMMATMFSGDPQDDTFRPRTTRGNAAALAGKAAGEADLAQLLQNEKLNGPADRDMAVATKDTAHFRGFFIYIHDMDEKTRPVMIRDYPKPATKEEGKWPQFRLTGPGKCPFVEDPNHVRRVQLQEQQQKAAQIRAERAQSAAPKTRAITALENAERRVLAENTNVAKRPTSAASQSTDILSKPLEPPKIIPTKRGTNDNVPPLFGSAQANLRAIPRFAGGEPVASGVQPSNITSAIKSQMISSTAAAPGARAGTSKEMHQLQRKILEKNSGTGNGMPSSYMNEVRAAINGERAAPRAAKRKAQETLANINEDGTPSEEEEKARKVAVVRKRKVVEKELKPGYCENCREKFNDFDEHVVSRKHRKFATTQDNWRELDDLLSQLARPMREVNI